jgi:hypothetical protein
MLTAYKTTGDGSRHVSQYSILSERLPRPDTNWAQIDVLAVAISKSAANLASLTGGDKRCAILAR